MFCSKCGFRLDQGDGFCPNCGEKVLVVHQSGTAPQNEWPQQPAPGQQNDWAQQNGAGQQYAWQQPAYAVPPQAAPEAPDGVAGKKAAKKKEGGKRGLAKVIAPIAAAVAVIAVIVTGIFLFPRLMRSGYSADNVFASAMKDADRKSDDYAALEALATVHNTVFNSSSLTVNATDAGETFFRGKLIFGKDLLDSSCFANLFDDYYVIYKDGLFIGTEDGYDTYQIMAADIMKDRQQLVNYGKIMTQRASAYFGDEVEDLPDGASRQSLLGRYEQDANTLLESLDRYVFSVVKDNHLNFDTLNELFTFLGPDALTMLMMYAPEETMGVNGSSEVLRDLKFWYGCIANCIAQGTDGAFTVTKTSIGGGAEQYQISIDFPRLAKALFRYIDSSKEVRALLGDALVNQFIEEYGAEIPDSDPRYTMQIFMTVDDRYVSDIAFGSEMGYDDFRFIVSDVNRTVITADEQNRVRTVAAAGDDIYTYSSAQQLIDMIEDELY